MGQRAQTAKEGLPRTVATHDCPCAITREDSQKKGGKTVEYGRILIRTVRHFWPELTGWMDAAPDTRSEQLIIYDKKFLIWWGILLYVLKLGSRRQLDYDLRDLETCVLDNVNRLACTTQETLPVHGTLRHFVAHVAMGWFSSLRTFMVRRLIRMKALDFVRLAKAFVFALDGTGYLLFKQKHCDACLTQDHGGTKVYFHPVLEAKLVGIGGLALSVGTEFIENTDTNRNFADYEDVKQDCELKAFARLAPQIKKDYPQTPIIITGDSAYGCGTAMQICKEHGWSFVFTFKKGRTPALWSEFEALCELQGNRTQRYNVASGIRQRYEWVNNLPFKDSYGRHHRLNAILCRESRPMKTTTYAWITDIDVNSRNVVDIAQKGGRIRSKIENQGFNVQKNSGLNLEHAYSHGPQSLKTFYILLQIAHIILQMVEMGSLLKNMAKQYHTTIPKLTGGLKNYSRRLLECFRHYSIPDEAYDLKFAAACQIRLDTG